MKKIVCITGPTCSGKTDMAIAIAKQFNGEIISSDSRLVFRDMDIVTAKPLGKKNGDIYWVEDIPHYLIDIIDSNEEYSLYEWKRDAEFWIEDILKRGKLPIIAGGTPIYTSAITDGYEINTNKKNPKYNSLVLCIQVDRNILYTRINTRVQNMIQEGLLEEAKKYYKNIGTQHLSMSKTAHGYKHIFEYFEGNITLDEAIQEMQKDTRNYAKRQCTWWRHHGNPIFIHNTQEASQAIEKFLQ